MASLESWHIGKQITLGNVLTGLAAITAIAIWILDLQERVTIVEYKVDQQQIQTDIIRDEVRGMGAEIIHKLDGIEDKQYQHIENHAPAVSRNDDATAVVTS